MSAVSKRGRVKNRERRAARAAKNEWTALRAGREAVAARNELTSAVRTNPYVILQEVFTLQDGLETINEQLRRQGLSLKEANEVSMTWMSGLPAHEIPQATSITRDLVMDALTSLAGPGGSEVARNPYFSRSIAVFQHLASQTEAALRASECYVISPGMHAVAVSAAETLTSADVFTWSESDLPAPQGMVYLPHPQVVTLEGQAPKDLRAISWYLADVHIPDTGWRRAVNVTSWSDADGPVQVADFNAMRRVASAAGHPFPKLVRDSKAFVVLDSEATEAEREQGAHTGTALRRALDTAAGSAGEVGEFAGDSVADPAGDFEKRYLFAFMRLAAQEIAVLDTKNLHAREVGRAPDDEQIRIATLRSFSNSPPSDENPARAYRHRWLVRMHKVRQWYPSEGRHKVIWRGPYIKGPEDAPLLASERVNALVR